MSREMGTRKVDQEYTVSTTCDWCKRTNVHAEWPKGSDSPTFRGKSFELNDFSLKWEVGEVYPEDGHWIEYTVDLCLDCRPKFIRLLEAHGITPAEREVDT